MIMIIIYITYVIYSSKFPPETSIEVRVRVGSIILELEAECQVDVNRDNKEPGEDLETEEEALCFTGPVQDWEERSWGG